MNCLEATFTVFMSPTLQRFCLLTFLRFRVLHLKTEASKIKQRHCDEYINGHNFDLCRILVFDAFEFFSQEESNLRLNPNEHYFVLRKHHGGMSINLRMQRD